MYSLTAAQIASLQTGLTQARITYTLGNTTLVITNSDIVQGGLTIDRYCASGEKLEIGSAIAAELTLKLLNYDGRFDDVVFDGAELAVSIGKNNLWVPCGVYRVADPPRKQKQINITALDRMTKFDDLADGSAWTYPMTLQAVVQNICTGCGVTLATDLTQLPNYDLSVLYLSPSTSTTWRTVLQHAALLMGCNAYMDRNGQLALDWYNETSMQLTPSNRFVNTESDIHEQDITIGGLEYSDATETYTYGTGYRIACGGSCIAFNENIDTVMAPVLARVQGLVYRPYTAGTFSTWHMDLMDGIDWVDADGNTIPTIITNLNNTLNAGSTVKAIGEDAAKSIYNTSGMTREIENAIDNMDVQIGGANLINLSEIAIVGTITVNDGVLAANGKDLEISKSIVQKKTVYPDAENIEMQLNGI